MAETQQKPHVQLIEDYVDVWNGDLGKLEDVVAEDVVVRDPAHPDGEVRGREAFADFVEQTREAFPDFTIHKDTDGMLASEDVVMLEWTASGTLEAPFFGVPPTGRSMTVEGMARTRVEDGLIAEDDIVFDQKDMLDQLGFAFPDVVTLVPTLVKGKLTGSV